MALVLKDRVLETSQTSGTGTIALSGAVNNFQSFSSAIGNGNTTYYAIVDDSDNQWEVGLGTVGANTLTRDTVLASSNGGSKVNFGTSIKNVFCDYSASKAVTLDSSGNSLYGGNSYENFSSIAAPTYSEGRLWYDSTQKTLAYYNDVTNNLIHIGQEVQVKVINNTGSTIALGSPVYVTSTSSGQIYPNVALAKADVQATSAVLGLTTQAITNGSTGYVTTVGILQPCNTGTFTVGDVLYLSPYSAGQLMNTVPPTGYAVQVGIVAYSNSPNGSIYVRQAKSYVTAAQIVGTVAVANGGTGATTASGARTNLGLGTIATQDASAVAITGGTIDNTVIGGTTPAAGTFTTITGQTEVLKGTGSNLLLQSSVLTNAAWGTSALTITGSQTDPFGGTTAALLNDGLTTNIHYVFQTLTFSAVPYTYSIYAKAGTSNYIGIVSPAIASGVIFNLSNGTFSANIVNAPTAYSITAVTGATGWYRCSITFTPSAGSQQVYVFMSENGTSYSFTGTGLTSYIAAPQLEVGTSLNTYIPTTTTAVYGTPTLSFSGVAGLGLQSDGSLYVSPAGTGAIQAQATTSSTVGGNARGANAVDWQTSRASATQVASSSFSTIGGGANNTASTSNGTTIAGGRNNNSTAQDSFVGGGNANTSSGLFSSSVGGASNVASGYYGFVGGGQTNSTTSNSAVTTQSGTMNATTAVTLSGSNASIKVGQLITGTSIATGTYVAAISGTSLTLSQAASGSSTSTLSFYTPHGVVVGGGNNQATGSYSFIGGGGDAGTAANRNVASGDWSVVGGGTANQATGLYSVVAGGATNTATNTRSAVLSGRSCNATGSEAVVLGGSFTAASGSSSLVSGYNGTTRSISGLFSYSGANAGVSQGNVQIGTLILYRQTTDATATALTSDTSAASGTNQVILPNNSAYYFTGEVVSGVTGGGDSKGWSISGVIKRGANAASTTLVGSTVTSLYADAGATTWTIGLTADTTNGGLKVTFTGQAATTIRTVCQLRTTEMTF